MHTTRLARVSMTIVASMSLVAACGGGSDDSSTAPASQDTAATDAEVDSAAADAATSSATTEADTTTGSVRDLEPGDVEFRVVNVLDQPVDIYVRTSGLVEAFTIAVGVEPGAVTELVAPPADGVFLVTEAGAGDTTCVTGCDHFITELSASEEQGPVHTVVLYSDEFGEPASFDLWEQPGPGSEGNSNAMVPADPASPVVVVTGIALTDASFGLRLAIDGAPGCVDPFNLENILVGGNQTPAFTYDGDTVELVLHDNTDRECVEEPVGGPFTVDGGPGTRSHLILTGSPGDMAGTVVAMIDANGASGSGSGSDDEAMSTGDRDLAIELMTAEVAANLAVDDAQAACAAELLVDAIGVEPLFVDGDFIDLDTLPTEFDDVAAQALFEAITVCNIDPSSLGG